MNITYAEVNLDNLLENFLLVKKLAPNSKIMAIIKGDAYGVGAV